MDINEVLERLRVRIADCGNASAWAHSVGCSPSYVSDVLSRRREPGPAILDALGLKSITIYQETSK